MLQLMGIRSGRAVLTAAFALFAFGLAGGAKARPLEDVRQSGVLRVNVYTDAWPFSWVEDDKVLGIDADVGRAVAAALGLKADIIARAAGESVDDDIRSNIWQGPRTGGVKGDVMLHVPMDRELIARNNLAAISSSYYHEDVVLALKTDVLGKGAGLDDFQDGKGNKVACQFATSAHYFLAFAQDGKLRNNVSPYIKFESAAENFFEGGSSGLMARRAQVEAAVHGKGLSLKTVVPEFPETLKSNWNIGIAVKEDSRDLGYAVGGALRKLRSSGELAKIFEKYGVSYVAPK